MTSFIEEVLDDLIKEDQDLSSLQFVLPNKRAGLFLKKIISKKISRPVFSPEILSIEEFIETVSQIKYAENIDLLLDFYTVYLQETPEEEYESFENVMSWCNMLIQDFNNIDRHLINPSQLFDYLSDIKDLNHWSFNPTKSNSIESYLNFWRRLKHYYFSYKKLLLSKRRAYQGLVYREAVSNIKLFCENNRTNRFVFIGFNALNKAEESIFQYLIENEMARIYWDAEQQFLEDPIHDAGYFMRLYLNSWPYYKSHSFKTASNYYRNKKTIQVIGTPKNIGQVKYVGSLLEEKLRSQQSLEDTAVVLGDESLLIPLLNSLPSSIGPVNITMGLPLIHFPIASLFDFLFSLHQKRQNVYYYKDVINILTHPLISELLKKEEQNKIQSFLTSVKINNLSYLTVERIKEEFNALPKLSALFNPWKYSHEAIKRFKELINSLKEDLNAKETQDALNLEYLYRFHRLFNELERLLNTHQNLKSISSLYTLYKELIKNETLDFKGEPLQGLQILGMLETRVLDFKDVIVLSVNEGILPAGKSENSFIPLDVKRENELPTFKEMDAVYTYHFYRLLHRSNTVHLVYNTEPDVLSGGEKSRFIYQLQFEKLHKINLKTLSSFAPSIQNDLKSVEKSLSTLEKLTSISEKGFSPSSLTNYIRNPIDFYYQTILGIREEELVEESIAYNTMGTILHHILEHLYKPYVNKQITAEDVSGMIKAIPRLTDFYFQQEYKEGIIDKGKNLIVYNICKKYLQKLLLSEKKLLEEGNVIKILGVERKLRVKVQIPELNFPIYLRGTVDRIDEFNGIKRVIDYKSGKVTQAEVEIVEWMDLTSDYKKFSKSFQILCYAYMLNSEQPFNTIEAGIISFKNLNGNPFLKFGIKDSPRSKKKIQSITNETLMNFEEVLKSLIMEICNPKIPFTEKRL